MCPVFVITTAGKALTNHQIQLEFHGFILPVLVHRCVHIQNDCIVYMPILLEYVCNLLLNCLRIEIGFMKCIAEF